MKVTKTFLPPFSEYVRILERVWESGWITNHGPLLQEAELQIASFLGLDEILVCTNGTVALQLAIKSLGVSRCIITTPYSYVATLNSVLWEGCKPIFVDINPNTFCIDPERIEEAITEDTEAILATHVYGFPCDVHAISQIADKFGLKVIYDGAHAFGVTYEGRSLLSYGDISTCSFHATKLFQMAEGGCLISPHPEVMRRVMLMRQFGHIHDEYHCIGINAKVSELHAAMGLAVLKYLPAILQTRKHAIECYLRNLPNRIVLPFLRQQVISETWNYGYMPVQFASEEELIQAKQLLEQRQIFPRRYFWPALHKLPIMQYDRSLPIAEKAAATMLCLPLYHNMSTEDISLICSILQEALMGLNGM